MKKRILAGIMAVVTGCGMLAGCKGGSKKSVTILSAAEDYRNENIQKMLNEKFPDYNIELIYNSTGDMAAKLAAEGKNADFDIVIEMETTYAEKMKDNFLTQTDVDYSVFMEDQVPADKKYVPWLMLSGAVIINRKVLDEKGVPVPTSYDDLLKPEYKGLVSMPNPKSSGTGYIFLLNLVNERGEAGAFEYFDKLAANISGQGFTTSGSGPVKALITGEAGIGLGITYQAAEEIDKGVELEIMFFEEGAPYTTYSAAIIDGKEKNSAVKEVFDYLISEVSREDKRLYGPEPVFREQTTVMKNFPKDIKYGNMEGIKDITLKESLLDKWNH